MFSILVAERGNNISNGTGDLVTANDGQTTKDLTISALTSPVGTNTVSFNVTPGHLDFKLSHVDTSVVAPSNGFGLDGHVTITYKQLSI